MSEEENLLIMCWFGFYQPYATSIVHDPEQEISPKEIDTEDLVFIWDKYMKSDLLTELVGAPVPWSPAYIEGYSREWHKMEDGHYRIDLVRKEGGKCLGAVIFLSRLKEDKLKLLTEVYEKRGYTLQKITVLIGDLNREIRSILPS